MAESLVMPRFSAIIIFAMGIRVVSAVLRKLVCRLCCE